MFHDARRKEDIKFVASLKAGSYFIFLISRTQDPITKKPNKLWGMATSSGQSGLGFIPEHSEDRLVRKAEEVDIHRFSISVSSLVIEAITQICAPPFGGEIADAAEALRSYRDIRSEAFGNRLPNNKDVSTNISSRHTAAAIRLLLLADGEAAALTGSINWLLDNQKAPGGWAFDTHSEPDFYCTAYCIDGLFQWLRKWSAPDDELAQKCRRAIKLATAFIKSEFDNSQGNKRHGLWIYKERGQYIGDSGDTLSRLMPLVSEEWVSDEFKAFLKDRMNALLRLQMKDGSFGVDEPPSFGPSYSRLANSLWALHAIKAGELAGDTSSIVHRNLGLDYVLTTLKSVDNANQPLWLVDWAVLACVLSHYYPERIGTEKVKSLRSIVSRRGFPNILMSLLPSDLPLPCVTAVKYVVTNGGRNPLGIFSRTQETLQRVPKWLWPAIGAVAAVAGLLLRAFGFG